ncbi:MAG: hypothetical protein HOV81_32835 [Kofleriaceae bacterium]|nr:hypothetical protein [Kofleriaceae bacterium]
MRKLSLLALVLGFAACRGDDTSGDDMQGSDANPQKTEYTIQEIQNDSLPACDPATPTTCVQLTIKGVVVTAIDTYGTKTGDFWVQEPEGGPFSGVHVYGAPLDQVAALQLGDVVDITGAQKAEFALTSDTSGNKLTELEPVEGGTMTVTKVMSGTPLEPTVVDALAIGQMSDFMARAAEWEKWEGVLVKVNNPQAFSNDKCVGSACNDATLRSFELTGDVLVESALAAMPDPAVKLGDCFTSVTGVVDYFFDYQILPRTTAEIASGGTACPRENDATTCGDDIDNDGNGFKDCADFSCQAAVSSCASSATVAAIQMGTTTGTVTLSNVVVTARDEAGGTRGIYVADALQAAQYNGVFVYMGSASPPANLVVGATVNVTGNVLEFDVGNAQNPAVGDKMTEISNSTVTFVAAPTGTPMPATTANAQTLSDIGANGEPWEGVFVQLTNLKVTNNALGNNKVQLTDNNGVNIVMDDDLFVYPTPVTLPANNTCFATVTGVMNVQLNDDIRTINPRTMADMVIGTGCN